MPEPIVTIYSSEHRNGMSAVLDDVLDLFENYTHVKRLKSEQANAIADAHLIGALWSVGSWFVTDCPAYPYLMVTAADKNSGKSTVQQLLFHIVRDPIKTSNATAAAIFHACAQMPTLLIDEVDTFIKQDPSMEGVLNSGYTRGSSVTRLTKKGEVENINTYCAKSLSGIKANELSETLTSRSLVMTLERKPNHVILRDLDNLDENPNHSNELTTVNQKIAAAYIEYKTEFIEAAPSLPSWLQNRNRQLWKPLLKLAYIGGHEWFDAAICAAKRHCDRQTERDGDDNLLSDIRDAFDAKLDCEFISSAELIKYICSDQLKRWQTLNQGKPITPRQVSEKLKAHEIFPTRNKTQTCRGYHRSDFEAAWASYCTHPETSVYPSTFSSEPALARLPR
jgi:putative DNA primase/helicase